MTFNCPPDEQLLAVASDELISPEVREHVEQCADCQRRVKVLCGEIAELRSLSNPLAGKQTTDFVTWIASPPLPNATAIGRYVIVANLGSGGQADVYRVIDPNLGRHLVLKLSHRQSNDEDGRRDALLAEGRLLAELDHPGLVRIFDVGIHDGRPYLVLEHVSGRNLEQIFADKKPSAREAARLMAEVARVIAYAHRRGIVHGDITPRNILIDAQGRARLIDFGLSKIEDAWGENAGPSGGTPEFLPPEIIPTDDRPGRASPASDVFGMGATLYWLLTGQPPFVATSVSELIERARRCDIDFDALRLSGTPGRIARICRQALAANPADRPTPEVLANVLQRASRRWSSPPFVAALVAMILASGGLYLWLRDSREPPAVENANVIHSVPTINVFHRDGMRTLSNDLPLRTGDRVAVWCSMSQGHEAIVLWFNAAGELKTFSPVHDVADKVDRLVYPAPHRSISLEPPEGTDMIFFCRGGPVADDEVRACFPLGIVVPPLPAQNWLTLLRSEVKIEGPMKSEVPDEIVRIEGMLKQIERQLRRYYPGVTGIAFPHRVASETAE
jgi:serine/threonine protein kinase